MRLHSIQKVSASAIRRGKLPFFLGLVLPDTNKARRIAFTNCFLNSEKFRFALQIGTARKVKDFVIHILGHGYKSRNCRRIGSAPWTLALEPGQDNSFC